MVLQYIGSVHSLDHAWLVKHAYMHGSCVLERLPCRGCPMQRIAAGVAL